MSSGILSVREAEQKDIKLIADYWFTAEPAYLEALGVDLSKMPAREQFMETLSIQVSLPYPEKKAYALIWEAYGRPIAIRMLTLSYLAKKRICTSISGNRKNAKQDMVVS